MCMTDLRVMPEKHDKHAFFQTQTFLHLIPVDGANSVRGGVEDSTEQEGPAVLRTAKPDQAVSGNAVGDAPGRARRVRKKVSLGESPRFVARAAKQLVWQQQRCGKFGKRVRLVIMSVVVFTLTVSRGFSPHMADDERSGGYVSTQIALISSISNECETDRL